MFLRVSLFLTALVVARLSVAEVVRVDVDVQPPKLGKPFPSQVSRVDELGNEIAGIRALEILVPLATYAPWSLRTGMPGGEDELTNFIGTYIPLPQTEDERRQARDSRPSIESLYTTKQDYLAAASLAAKELVDKRLLLPEERWASRGVRTTRRASRHPISDSRLEILLRLPSSPNPKSFEQSYPVCRIERVC
jgi:hypothetical protein